MKGLRSNEILGNMIIAAHCHLLSDIQTIHIFIVALAAWGGKSANVSILGSCLTLSTLLMDSKLDCQKLKGSLSEYFFVGSPSTTALLDRR